MTLLRRSRGACGQPQETSARRAPQREFVAEKNMNVWPAPGNSASPERGSQPPARERCSRCVEAIVPAGSKLDGLVVPPQPANVRSPAALSWKQRVNREGTIAARSLSTAEKPAARPDRALCHLCHLCHASRSARSLL
jgi:hypothetical protein